MLSSVRSSSSSRLHNGSAFPVPIGFASGHAFETRMRKEVMDGLSKKTELELGLLRIRGGKMTRVYRSEAKDKKSEAVEMQEQMTVGRAGGRRAIQRKTTGEGKQDVPGARAKERTRRPATGTATQRSRLCV